MEEEVKIFLNGATAGSLPCWQTLMSLQQENSKGWVKVELWLQAKGLPQQVKTGSTSPNTISCLPPPACLQMNESTGRDIIGQVNQAHVTVASFQRHQVFYQYALGPETSYRNQTIIPGCVEHDNLSFSSLSHSRPTSQSNVHDRQVNRSP